MPKPRKRKIKQIKYDTWGSNLSNSKHLNYFWDIQAIAHYIAMDLEAFTSMRGKDDSYMLGKASSIIVDSFKEKFGVVRVYCQLAQRDVLEREWTMGAKEKYDNFDEFVRKSYLTDAQLYRRAYLTAVDMWPQYEDAILACPDYGQYLCRTEKEFNKECKNNPDWEKDRRLVEEVCCWPKSGSTFGRLR